MRWQKLGRVYVPRAAPPWLASHAAVPIAEPLENGLWRVYFAGRDEFQRSHTACVDLDLRDPDANDEAQPRLLLAPGPPGTFDDAGAMPSWLVTHGRERYLYYVGWNVGGPVPFRNAVGLAISGDGGRTYERAFDGPIMDRSVHDPCFVSNPCVLHDAGHWRMWYLSGLRWEGDGQKFTPYYHIKYAESDDGIDWRRTGRISIELASPDEHVISRPCVIRDADLYRMWYSYRGTTYRIGYAESLDGLNWTRSDQQVGIDVSSEGWDQEMIEYAFVFDAGIHRLMLYNGNGYGRSGFGLARLERGS
jgi:hypothetical protein